MGDFTNLAFEHIKNWDLTLLRHELRLLERERKHLLSKSDERTLTTWESRRMEELLDEAMQLVMQLSKVQSVKHLQLTRVK